MLNCCTEIVLVCISEDSAEEIYSTLNNWLHASNSLREFLAQTNLSIDTSDDEYLGIIKCIDRDKKNIIITECTESKPLLDMWIDMIYKFWGHQVLSFRYMSWNDETKKYLTNMPFALHIFFRVLCNKPNKMLNGIYFEGNFRDDKLKKIITDFFKSEDICYEETDIRFLVSELSYLEEKIDIFPYEYTSTV